MKILDRYIVRRFMSNLIFALLAFVAIFVVVDMVERLDLYIDRDVPATAIILLYVYYLPFIFVMSMPVGVLLASLFCTGWMAKYNELVAMKATGTSIYRILAPMLAIGLCISGFNLFLDELVAPAANRAKKNIELTHIDPQRRDIRRSKTNLTYRDRDDRRIVIRFYDSQSKSARNVSIQEYSGAFVRRRIDVQTMEWVSDSWQLVDGIERNFDGIHEEALRIERQARPDLTFVPEELAKVQLEPEEMSSAELREFIDEVKRSGGAPDRWATDLNLKFAFPFANFIIVLIGASLAANKRRSGAAVGFGISLLVCFLYFGLIKMGQSLGYTGTLPPALAPWLGNFVFLLVGITLLSRTQT